MLSAPRWRAGTGPADDWPSGSRSGRDFLRTALHQAKVSVSPCTPGGIGGGLRAITMSPCTPGGIGCGLSALPPAPAMVARDTETVMATAAPSATTATRTWIGVNDALVARRPRPRRLPSTLPCQLPP